MTRAYVSNPTTRATTGVISATFDLPTGLVPNAAALQQWKVRRWDGVDVDVTWWEPFIAQPGGSVTSAVAQFVGTIPAGSNRLQLTMVLGANRPPSFALSPQITSLIQQSEATFSW